MVVALFEAFTIIILVFDFVSLNLEQLRLRFQLRYGQAHGTERRGPRSYLIPPGVNAQSIAYESLDEYPRDLMAIDSRFENPSSEV